MATDVAESHKSYLSALLLRDHRNELGNWKCTTIDKTIYHISHILCLFVLVVMMGGCGSRHSIHYSTLELVLVLADIRGCRKCHSNIPAVTDTFKESTL